MHLIFVLLTFKFRTGLIILACLVSFSAWSQSNVSGKVVDTLGNPLKGASINIRGTNRIAKTNKEGNFSLQQVSSPSIVIIVSCSGFTDKEVNVSPDTNNLVVTLSKKEWQW